MRVWIRELIFLLICGIGAIIIVQIADDMARQASEIRAERRARRAREQHNRYE